MIAEDTKGRSKGRDTYYTTRLEVSGEGQVAERRTRDDALRLPVERPGTRGGDDDPDVFAGEVVRNL